MHNIRSCSTEGINRLIVIAHNVNVIIGMGKHSQNPILNQIRILKLIHHDIRVHPSNGIKNISSLRKQLITMSHHIIKVQKSHFLLIIRISFIKKPEIISSHITAIIIININHITGYNSKLIYNAGYRILIIVQILINFQ